LARAKNTSRAEARRRTRETIRAESAELENGEDLEESIEPAPEPARRPLFRMPNVREDIRALPSMFRTHRLLWLPLLLLVVGFILVMTLRELPPSIVGIAGIFVEFFFLPPALFTFFVAGFIAPRASYLVGLLYGAIAGVLWFIGLVSPALVPDTATFVGSAFSFISNGVVFGTLAAAFAAWYRDFLRQMQQRGRDRRADQEAKERAKRREERQEARRIAKQRT
jgi:signal transduction histidine kinase